MKSLPAEYQLGSCSEKVLLAFNHIQESKFIERLWNRDFTLWSSQPVEIVNRLAWLDSPKAMLSQMAEIGEFCAELKEQGYRQALLLGMGGSSLAPEVFRKVFGVLEGWIDLAILDSTDPQRILREQERLDLARTLFIVSTKSGGTVETLSFFYYFYNLVVEAVGQDEAGQHFLAITDPGSSLIELAETHRFRRIFLNEPDLGGRYSAFSHFGCVPAALGGMDLKRLAAEAVTEMEQSGPENPTGEIPGVLLGVAIGELARLGRDKLTFLISSDYESFGDWVEQLIAESTGKAGRGIVPVVGEKVGDVSEYGSDRTFVVLQDRHSDDCSGLSDQLLRAGHPVMSFTLDDRYELGKHMYRWELATAVAGSLLGINPFDQPDVESAKQSARRMMKEFIEQGSFPSESPSLKDGPVGVYGKVAGTSLKEVLNGFLGLGQAGDYIALQAYLDTSPEIDAALDEIRLRLRNLTGLATTLGYGPRFLHSTGQLHKGDAGKGLFIQFTIDDQVDCPIPGQVGMNGSSVGFRVLKEAQARGDWEALQERHRRILRLHITSAAENGLHIIKKCLQ